MQNDVPTIEDDDERFDDADEAYNNEDASVDTHPCPYCGKPVYEQAELCPHCRSYISREDAVPHKPRWVVIVVIVLVAAFVLTWVIHGR